MSTNRKRYKSKYQFAGTIFFLLISIAVLLIGITVNTEDSDAATEKVISVSEKRPANTPTYLVYTPVEVEKPVTTVITEPAEITEVEKAEQVESTYYDVPLSEDIQDYIFELSEEYGVPSEVIIGVIRVESNYKADAVGGVGELGYMQIHPMNFEYLSEELGVTDFTDPYQSILCGTYKLSKLYKKYDTLTEILMCYNCGETGAKRLWDDGVTETEYTKKVISVVNELTKGA